MPKGEKFCRTRSFVYLLANLCQAHSSTDLHREFADGGVVSDVTFWGLPAWDGGPHAENDTKRYFRIFLVPFMTDSDLLQT